MHFHCLLRLFFPLQGLPLSIYIHNIGCLLLLFSLIFVVPSAISILSCSADRNRQKSQRFIGSFLLYYLLHLSIFFLLFPAVAVLEARKLKKMDITGASDPYVKIKLFDNKVSVEYGVVSRPKLITEKAFSVHSFMNLFNRARESERRRRRL